jgi:peptide/histidine transporter 3/4
LSAIVIILAYIFFSGVISGITDYLASSAIFTKLGEDHSNSLLLWYGSYSITVLGLLLYPVFGFMADVCCGRYWTVTVSVCIMTAGLLLTTILAPLYVEFKGVDGINPLIITLMVVTFLMTKVGVAAFEANVVQFGLDQLMDHSSRCLSFFLHLIVWLKELGIVIVIFPLTLQNCDKFTGTTNVRGAFRFLPLVVLVLFVLPLVFLIKKRDSFYRELGSINPYKMVVKILGFALKNRHPQRRRSAFFYYYGLNPGRLDFAKVHYGGPYETEHVENVKTLLQILIVLICVGPVFILSVSTSYFMYQHFVQHLVVPSLMKEYCYSFWPLMGSGNQKNLLTVLTFPIYTLIVFKVLKNIPKIFLRLLMGLTMTTLCMLCVLVIEVAGHYAFEQDPSNGNRTLQCALAVINQTENSLNVPWASLFVPNVLYGLASPIVQTTVLEFISAQSPKSMTGLLIGTFYLVNGFFQLIGTVTAVPFSLGRLWHTSTDGDASSGDSSDYWNPSPDSQHTMNNTYPIYSITCEVWYLTIMVLFGVVGIILYSLAVWKYKYRKREEAPFPQSDIEDIISRDIEQDTRNLLDAQNNLLDVSSEGVHAPPERRRMVYST